MRASARIPPADMLRAAWLNVDRNSTVWVTAWPTRDGYLSNPEFAEVATWYFGLPSPACGPLVGQRIADTKHVMDRHFFFFSTRAAGTGTAHSSGLLGAVGKDGCEPGEREKHVH